MKEISFPVGGIQFSNDHSHRLHFVDFHIALRRWLAQEEQEPEFFHCYFDKVGAQRRKDAPLQGKTRVSIGERVILPDGIFRFERGGKSRLCAVEIHNGVDTKKITEQLKRHITALEQGAISDKYQHRAANFVLSVYENAATLNLARKRLAQEPHFSEFSPLFHFNTIENIKRGFPFGWILASGEASTLFDDQSHKT